MDFEVYRVEVSFSFLPFSDLECTLFLAHSLHKAQWKRYLSWGNTCGPDVVERGKKIVSRRKWTKPRPEVHFTRLLSLSNYKFKINFDEAQIHTNKDVTKVIQPNQWITTSNHNFRVSEEFLTIATLSGRWNVHTYRGPEVALQGCHIVMRKFFLFLNTENSLTWA